MGCFSCHYNKCMSCVYKNDKRYCHSRNVLSASKCLILHMGRLMSDKLLMFFLGFFCRCYCCTAALLGVAHG